MEALGDRVSPGRIADRRKAAVRQKVANARERVMGTTEQAREGVAGTAGGATTAIGTHASSAASTVGEGASAMASSVSDTVSHTPDMVRARTEGSPLAAGLVAFGAGMVLAGLLPATDKEKQAAQAVQPALDTVKGELRTAAQDAVEDLKPTAQGAVTDLRDTAQQAVTTVTDQAHGAADATRSEAQEKVQEVRGADPAPQPSPTPSASGSAGNSAF
jgi:F0F1-type ATP synthase membrane subunit b/b'